MGQLWHEEAPDVPLAGTGSERVDADATAEHEAVGVDLAGLDDLPLSATSRVRPAGYRLLQPSTVAVPGRAGARPAAMSSRSLARPVRSSSGWSRSIRSK